MDWPKTRVKAEDRVELLQQLMAQRKKLFVGGQRHGCPLLKSDFAPM
jgi:hypothetical protein